MWYTSFLNINSLCSSNAIWRYRSGSTLAQVMACCLMAPSHYLKQCWLIISKVLWYSPGGKFSRYHSQQYVAYYFNILRLRENGHHFADDIFKCIFLNEDVWIMLKISLKFVPKVRINNIPALVQIMAWRRPGDKPLAEPMMVSLLTHICVTRPQWVKINSSMGTWVNWNTFPVITLAWRDGLCIVGTKP